MKARPASRRRGFSARAGEVQCPTHFEENRPCCTSAPTSTPGSSPSRSATRAVMLSWPGRCRRSRTGSRSSSPSPPATGCGTGTSSWPSWESTMSPFLPSMYPFLPFDLHLSYFEEASRVA
jgi:hypothetical protein